MRIGEVIGTVTLNRSHPSLEGLRLRIVVPLSLANLVGTAKPAADDLVVVDVLGAGVGSRIAFSEGPEAAQPFRPEVKPVDAYNTAILDHLDFTQKGLSGEP